MISQFPDLFLERLEEIYPDNHKSILSNLTEGHLTTFWLNPMRGNIDDTYKKLIKEKIPICQVPGFKEVYSVPPENRRDITYHRFASDGRIYIVNPSSLIPPIVLNPQPGENILDLTAAPGSKTIQIAALMENTGNISAVDIVRHRYYKLKANLERNGVSNASIYNKDGISVWINCPEQFDRVLLDAPCTTESRFNIHDEKTYHHWSKKKILEMNRKQRQLLYSAVQSLKPGGTLVYSTCTFSPEENELTVHSILKKFKNVLTTEPISINLPTATDPLKTWKNKILNDQVKKCIRILPDKIFEGFFICKFKKHSSTI
ncbi:MAG: RsmB/NOP family class I SAM-dependent RNA methyltransferase [Candidatus Marinimicrobia bacterium]|jgi:16S rRNA (cytosine1407-C5)-methyltransferase|nr:RsmB/NOP family class I SAM-dependent RNA methyltransferase [Candidatus Neomarinimicrobiota bacterium]MBT3633668.1 RsmB/NOP family class I SAM-dependent RNA methyltransferase [Candidatus Neomarinimicrobiota bacterium]MBT3682379.1 RsmB/NOP family class I SAM-dependent RNA methyltransferase [Candidatus Neomarinimicrobiota bacterium]MBT3759143.1 RsmB/NOP family class I SAM-dependent RNA methyltransferase [Candidatus Neomarinimicrobiota bacterium]MBT3895584.1 RsmB/NOP family class I SAM-dependen